jgi:chloramphenicol-sensitive protein RarD
VPVDGLLGLTIETMALAPLALGFLVWLLHDGRLTFSSQGRGLDVLIAASGVVTAVPLLLFGQAARRLSLTTLGFLQYLSPSLQFLLAVAQGEPFTVPRATCFSLIWAALAVFSFDSYRAARKTQANEVLQDV